MGESRYDRAITVFSPDGHLFQVEYAQEAVKKGSTAVGVRGKDVLVLAVEKKAVPQLQIDRTIRKIAMLDSHIAVTFAGLTADARVLFNRARIECQSHKLSMEDAVTVEYITRFMAELKQKYTQSNGRRPFGLSTLVVGFDPYDGAPHLLQTDPAGVYLEWKANAIGRNSKSVREYLERAYSDESVASERGTLKLALRALLEVVQSGAKNVEVAVLARQQSLRYLTEREIDELLVEINRDKEQEAADARARSQRH